jgi:hypothetical protein
MIDKKEKVRVETVGSGESIIVIRFARPGSSSVFPRENAKKKSQGKLEKKKPHTHTAKKSLHQPGIEPGPPAWQASILPLNH